MAREYGEGFQQPVDWETGLPIPGSPYMGDPTTNRPWNAGGNGIVVLRDGDPAPAPESKSRPPFARNHDGDGMR